MKNIQTTRKTDQQIWNLERESGRVEENRRRRSKGRRTEKEKDREREEEKEEITHRKKLKKQCNAIKHNYFSCATLQTLHVAKGDSREV